MIDVDADGPHVVVTAAAEVRYVSRGGVKMEAALKLFSQSLELIRWRSLRYIGRQIRDRERR